VHNDRDEDPAVPAYGGTANALAGAVQPSGKHDSERKTMHTTTDAIKRFNPFLDEVLDGYRESIDSVYITGSALTSDYDPKNSDINSVVVLKEMDLRFLAHLAPLGKKYGRKKLAAPLMMTPQYIHTSLDVFPIEFLNIKRLHHAVFGEDLFSDLDIQTTHLRSQCERELKVRLIGLRQGYLSSMGDPKLLTDIFVTTISGYIPLFRGVVLLLGKEPPKANNDVLDMLTEVSGVSTEVFKEILTEKKNRTKPSKERLNTIFESYYHAVEKLMEITDGIDA